MRILFCLFSENVGLLKRRELTQLVEDTRREPGEFAPQVSQLFRAMSTGGWFGGSRISHFNGGLFADASALPLTETDLDVVHAAGQVDWSSVEPTIFGTLFERGLDPSKRSQLGGFYTSRDDILLIVEPVLMAPVRRRWAEVQTQARQLVSKRDQATTTGQKRDREQDLQRLITQFQTELAGVRILDPACGSGNFLYVALKLMLDLEKELITSFSAAAGTAIPFPRVGPEQLYGIEINPYAHELAQVVVWIGYIQWLRDNGFGAPSPPILKPLNTIRHMDAIMAVEEDGSISEPSWPEADIIIGNPPFLGTKKMRAKLGHVYVENLHEKYRDVVLPFSDIVCYWFERTRGMIASGRAKRAGLLATNSITRGLNRRVLDRITDTGNIFMAWRDRPWALDGAQVRVSMVGFDNGLLAERTLDGVAVPRIFADLTAGVDLTQARRLPENTDLAFIGDVKGGPFDITADVAARMLSAPINPNGRSNDEVVRPWVNGLDVTRRPRDMWIIDFGESMSESDAASYELPFEYARRHVQGARSSSRETARYSRNWWIHVRPCGGMRAAVDPLPRFLATPTLAKHRLFVWLHQPTLPDHQLTVVARDDDYFFGILQSRIHQAWALRLGSSLEDRPRYTPTTTFETFPFPWPPGNEPIDHSCVAAIAEAARELNEKRERWLNPHGAADAELKKRTLTNLYNARPAWLQMAHEKLDTAVLAAYGWPTTLADNELLERLLDLNLSRAGVDPRPLPRRPEDSAPSNQHGPEAWKGVRVRRKRTVTG